MKPAQLQSIWFFLFFYVGHFSSSRHGAFGCPVAAPPGPGSQGWCCAALSQGGKLGQRHLPEAMGWVCGTIMRKPEDFVNPVKLSPYLIFFFFTLAFQKDFISLNNLLLAGRQVIMQLIGNCCHLDCLTLQVLVNCIFIF